MTRTVLFSDEALAKKLNEKFVSAWVNKATWEKFGDGLYDGMTKEQLDQFPIGTGVTNVTSIFARPDGFVVDAVPGYLDPRSFEAEVDFALELEKKMSASKDPVALYRKAHGDASKVERGPYGARAHERLAKLGPFTLESMSFELFRDFAPDEACIK